jgi:uncharacterized iron-regulated membrane protein
MKHTARVPCCLLGRLPVWTPEGAYAQVGLVAAGTAIVVLAIHEHVRWRERTRNAAGEAETWRTKGSDFALAGIEAGLGTILVTIILHVAFGASGIVLDSKQKVRRWGQTVVL